MAHVYATQDTVHIHEPQVPEDGCIESEAAPPANNPRIEASISALAAEPPKYSQIEGRPQDSATITAIEAGLAVQTTCGSRAMTAHRNEEPLETPRTAPVLARTVTIVALFTSDRTVNRHTGPKKWGKKLAPT